jgi:AcrR family transcriptional regulator
MPEEPMAARILKAAATEFAAHGVGGARVARIAQAARANKERLYHYFGNKEQLFDAVMDDAMRQISEAEPFAPEDLGAYVAAMADFHRSNPTLIRLLLAEARHHAGSRLPHDRERVAHYEQRVRAVDDAQAAGLVRGDIDPRVVVYTLLALVVTAEALPQLTEVILRASPVAGPLSPDEFQAGLHRLLEGLLARPTGR